MIQIQCTGKLMKEWIGYTNLDRKYSDMIK